MGSESTLSVLRRIMRAAPELNSWMWASIVNFIFNFY